MSALQNFQNLFELDTNPLGTANYVRLGDGIVTATPANNETIDTKSYYDDEGASSSETTGFQYTWSFSGDRIKGDDAQDYIFSKMFSVGAARKTNLRITGADGTVIVGGVTIANIVDAGGDAGATSAIAFDLMFNGKPSLTTPTTAAALTTTVAAGTVTGSTKFTATPGASNHLAYKVAAQLTAPNHREYVGDATTYTSGADILGVSATQVLHMYELDAYNHVVKFDSEVLDSGEIGA